MGVAVPVGVEVGVSVTVGVEVAVCVGVGVGSARWWPHQDHQRNPNRLWASAGMTAEASTVVVRVPTAAAIAMRRRRVEDRTGRRSLGDGGVLPMPTSR